MSDVTGFIVLIVGIVLVGLWTWALVDCFSRPRNAFDRSPLSRNVWLFLLMFFGLVLSPIYLLRFRRQFETFHSRPPSERELVDPSVLDGLPAEPGIPKPDPILVVDHVRRTFGGLTAVDVDHLEVQRGIITGLIGPNGAGKTTLFNLLTGFDTPDEGDWRFNGNDMAGSVAHRMAERGMVRTFQLTKALSKMTVLENMMLGATDQRGENLAVALWPPGWEHQEDGIEERAQALLERFNISHMADEYAGTLSGGQRKLLEMARALMVQPELVMLDEPMAGVNPALTQSLLEHVKELREEGMSVIFVEHDMDVVRDISDWVVVMAEGRVIAEGTHDDITGDQRVIDAYLGRDEDFDAILSGSSGVGDGGETS